MKENRWSRLLSRLLFPQDCPFCGGSMREGGLCCEECAPELPYLTDFAQLADKRGADSIDGLAASFRYESPVREAILRFKNSNHPEAARVFALWMAASVRQAGWIADCIVPIPSHRSRVRQRGFSPPALLAEQLGRALSLPIEKALLTLTRKPAPQHALNANERMRNLVGAYAAAPEGAGKRILLCDDIVTTGSTLHEAAAALKAAGAASIYAVALAAVLKKPADGYYDDWQSEP